MSLRHIFFDLDKTLWNHRANLAHAIEELHRQFYNELGHVPKEIFLAAFTEANERLWKLFSQGRITGPHLRFLRFRICLQNVGLPSNNLARRLSRTFLDIAPQGSLLEEGARETLQSLHSRYCLHIITNGFEITQRTKLRSSGIHHLFTTITTSERSGYRKPDPRIFRYALRRAGALASQAAFIGDDLEIDILPAVRMGFHTFWYNPSGLPGPSSRDFQNLQLLRSLPELPTLLEKISF
ncbi:MAG: HAD-IA family hydrolase [Flavobacteriales bacterium]|nr:HAD-IA family hydrolase [Flavobacteriales bacterium]MDW8409211.1 HAD-IA family hydrolase [Flavobacteriales bacterium]